MLKATIDNYNYGGPWGFHIVDTSRRHWTDHEIVDSGFLTLKEAVELIASQYPDLEAYYCFSRRCEMETYNQWLMMDTDQMSTPEVERLKKRFADYSEQEVSHPSFSNGEPFVRAYVTNLNYDGPWGYRISVEGKEPDTMKGDFETACDAVLDLVETQPHLSRFTTFSRWRVLRYYSNHGYVQDTVKAERAKKIAELQEMERTHPTIENLEGVLAVLKEQGAL